MWPLNTIIPKGGSMKVNCSVACDGNITSFGLETHWHKTEVDHRDKWKIFELSNVENDGTLLCHAVCQGNQTQVQGNLTVYCECLGPGGWMRQAGWGRWTRESPAGWDSLFCLVVGPESHGKGRWAHFRKASLSSGTFPRTSLGVPLQ